MACFLSLSLSLSLSLALSPTCDEFSAEATFCLFRETQAFIRDPLRRLSCSLLPSPLSLSCLALTKDGKGTAICSTKRSQRSFSQ